MPSSYPGGYDSFANPDPSDALDDVTVPHATGQHGPMNDAVEAVQATLGLDPQGTSATVSDRLGGIEGSVASVESALASKADLDSPTFTGDVVLPSTTVWDGHTIDELVASVGIPAGGLTGQVLAKASDADYDTAWVDPASLYGGGGGVDLDQIVDTPYPTGGTITTYVADGTNGTNGATYRVHQFFYTDGLPVSFTNQVGFYGKLLIVAGGGKSGNGDGNIDDGGGGGAGGYHYGDYGFGAGVHNLVVGRGCQMNQTVGGDSWIDWPGVGVYRNGGGAGANHSSDVEGTAPGYDGGSGGGAGEDNSVGGSGIPGQGYDGGNSTRGLSGKAGGGGGAGGAGTLGVGGPGVDSKITGTSVIYAKGGNGTGTANDPVQDTGSGADGNAGAGRVGANGTVIIRYRIA